MNKCNGNIIILWLKKWEEYIKSDIIIKLYNVFEMMNNNNIYVQ